MFISHNRFIRNFINKLLIKKNFDIIKIKIPMGQLPIARTHLEFSILLSSVDHTGPVLIIDRKGRGSKLL